MSIESRFTKAWDVLNSRPVDIHYLSRSRNGQNCNCICVECKKPLEACRGAIRKWYFRHQSKTDCKGGPMTALHLLAQYILTGTHSITTRAGIIEYDLGAKEFPIQNSPYRADIGGTKKNGEIFLIEILVTHHVDVAKISLMQTQRIHSIEIDLRKIDPEIKEGELREQLLKNVAIQKVIYDPTPISNTTVEFADVRKTPWYEDIVPVAVVAGLCYYFWKLVAPKRRRKRPR